MKPDSAQKNCPSPLPKKEHPEIHIDPILYLIAYLKFVVDKCIVLRIIVVSLLILTPFIFVLLSCKNQL